MVLELIARKNKPMKTKVQFTKKEWEEVSQDRKELYEKLEKHETSRHIYFLIDGVLDDDLIEEI